MSGSADGIEKERDGGARKSLRIESAGKGRDDWGELD